MKLPSRILLAAVTVVAASSAIAADGTWNVDANGNWSTVGNWTPGIADGSGSTAFFTNDITADRTVTLDTARTLGNIVFDDAGVSGDSAWTLSGANTLTLAGGTPTITTNVNATIGSVIAGSAGLTKSGTGTLVLSGANTYTGNTTVTGGTLEIGSTGGIYAPLSTQTISVSSGATLKISNAANNPVGHGQGQSWVIAGTFTQATTGVQILAGNVTLNGGTLTSTLGNATYGSFVVFNGDATVTANGTGNTISAVNFGINSGLTLTLATALSTDTLLASTVFKDGNTTGGKFTKTGAGTVTLTGANTYTGATTISGGTLTLGTGGSLRNTANITIAAGATLNLSDTGSAGSNRDVLTTAGTLVINGTLSNTGTNESRLNQTGITMNNGTITCSLASGDANFGSFLVDGAPRTITANGGSNKIDGAGYGIGLITNLTFNTALSGDALLVTARLGESAASGGGITKTGLGTVTISTASISGNLTGGISVNAGTLVFQKTASLAANSALTIANGATVNITSAASNSGFFYVINGATTVGAGSQVTLNDNSGAYVSGSQNTGTFFDGGLKTGGAGSVVILNAANAGNAFVFRNTNSNYAGKIIVNGIANSAVNQGSGIALSGSGASLQNADIELNGTMELGNQGMAWAASSTNGQTISIGALSGTGRVTSNGLNQTLSVGNTGANATFSGVIGNGANTVALIKAGAGTQTLSGANTYTGGTTISAGKLFVNNTTGSGLGTTGAVAVNGGTLGGTGIISGAGLVTVALNATLQGGVGAANGTLTINGGVTLATGSIIQLALNASGSDKLARTGGTWAFDANQKFNLIDLGGVAGTYTLISGLSGSEVGLSNVTTGWNSTSGLAGTFAYSAGNVTFTAVPEPSTYGLIGAVALAAVALVRRRRKLAGKVA